MQPLPMFDERMLAFSRLYARWLKVGKFECEPGDLDARVLGIEGHRVVYMDEGSIMTAPKDV
jgi:hypothetical protein